MKIHSEASKIFSLGDINDCSEMSRRMAKRIKKFDKIISEVSNMIGKKKIKTVANNITKELSFNILFFFTIKSEMCRLKIRKNNTKISKSTSVKSKLFVSCWN
jgi:hypothetical protein